ncbi:hypothetical protein [Aminobacter carboxidus]|uniref:Uncharacterized protein n=1 Tax=Aminobacter carboxidus TaxID=376165 RepID=A0A8E1WK45_9HYPH|nr:MULTISPECIES: hypothetical protein [Aminobacter carboxidus group]MBB6469968.1 hypothetical protein [Aminobacter lissarensis]MBE1203241.1 hypothetical protein [Aminobacter carboxidus]
MRFLFLIILLAGTGLGILYPWAATNFAGREIGTYRAYDRSGGYRPVEVALASSDAPVRVLVDLTTLAPPQVNPASAVLTITASTRGQTVLAEALNFYDTTPRERSPQLPDPVFRDDAGLIREVQPGSYRFVIEQGDADNIQIQRVDLILRSGGLEVDERAQPIGLSLLAVGFVGLVLSLRRKKDSRPDNPNSQAPNSQQPNSRQPAPRWGRDADKS